VVAAVVASALTVTAAAAHAQRPAGAVGLELRPVAGGLLPTGAQRDVLKPAGSLGGQVGWHFHENFALTGAFAWAATRDKTTDIRSSPLFTGRQEQVDVFDYNVGVEAGLPIVVAPSWTITPYVGLGGGGRSYHYRDVPGFSAETAPVGYGALGVDVLPAGPVGLRVEARDNVTGFKGLRGEYADRKARNDVQLSAGVALRF
jgi:hypothetical protein